jgi:hypothetical protein
MCEKCVEVEKKIAHYRLIESRMTDQTVLDGIKVLVAQLEAQKKELHPEGS